MTTLYKRTLNYNIMYGCYLVDDDDMFVVEYAFLGTTCTKKFDSFLEAAVFTQRVKDKLDYIVARIDQTSHELDGMFREQEV